MDINIFSYDFQQFINKQITHIFSSFRSILQFIKIPVENIYKSRFYKHNKTQHNTLRKTNKNKLSKNVIEIFI